MDNSLTREIRLSTASPVLDHDATSGCFKASSSRVTGRAPDGSLEPHARELRWTHGGITATQPCRFVAVEPGISSREGIVYVRSNGVISPDPGSVTSASVGVGCFSAHDTQPAPRPTGFGGDEF